MGRWRYHVLSGASVSHLYNGNTITHLTGGRAGLLGSPEKSVGPRIFLCLALSREERAPCPAPPAGAPRRRPRAALSSSREQQPFLRVRGVERNRGTKIAPFHKQSCFSLGKCKQADAGGAGAIRQSSGGGDSGRPAWSPRPLKEVGGWAVRPLQCPRSRAGWPPSSASRQPCGPLLAGLGPLLLLGAAPRAKGAGTSGPRGLV